MKWKIAALKLHELPALSRFFKSMYSGPGSYGSIDLFYWKAFGNPAGLGILNSIQIDGKIVSTTTITPKRICVNGKDYLSAEAGDSYTDPQYQRQGMLSQLVTQSTQDALNQGTEFLYTTPNQQSVGGYLKSGQYKEIPGLTVKSLKFRNSIRLAVEKRTHWTIGFFLNVIYLVIWQLFLMLRSFFLGCKKKQIEKISVIPNDWDLFWSRAKDSYDFCLVKDSKAISWRYFDHPESYSFYVARDEEGAICASLVGRMVTNQGVSSFQIADFLFLPDSQQYFTGLIEYVLQDITRNGASDCVVWCAEKDPCFACFKKVGFFETGILPVLYYANSFSTELVLGCKSWHFAIGDTDNV